jgi:hypothetical protein
MSASNIVPMESLSLGAPRSRPGPRIVPLRADGRKPCAFRPVLANQVGDREQGSPVVCRPIDEVAHVRVVVVDNGAIGPPRAHAGNVKQVPAPVLAQLSQHLVRPAPLHLDDDAPLLQVIRYLAVACVGDRAKDRALDQLELLAKDPHHRAALPVALVQ